MTDKVKAKGGKRNILISLLILAVMGIGGFAIWQSMHGRTPHSAALKEAAPPLAPVFFALDTFTVNLINPDNDPDRVLYVGLTLRLPNENTRKRLSDYLPEVRSRLLLLLSRQNATSLSGEQGKQALVKQIKEVLAPPLVPGQPPQVVSDVLFTAFILR